MDVVLYVAAAAVLLVLIAFAVKLRGKTQEADAEQQRDVARAAGVPQRAAEDRGAGMPRRRRMAAAMANRRPQREAVEPEEELDGEEDAEQQNFQATAKVGAKKQKKLEEKQAKKAQREMEMEEREERKRMQELREQERRQEDERERLLEQKQVSLSLSHTHTHTHTHTCCLYDVMLTPCAACARQEEDERRAKEEQERREEEEYLRLKASFVVEDQGEEEQLTEDQSRNLLKEFIEHIESSKVVLLEDLASHFGMRTQDAIDRLQDLLAEGSLTGVIDDRGKFISITPQELDSVAQFIRQRGRVSITELAQASNSLINLMPESRSAA
ncbi:DDRGK domain-containing protein 1 [Nibea albiflora]|uniref:DDRGK domain-containing protein 1 n=1 Tax=Nibea albiflora TaxID=240163 RepID=A0ACB7ER71_NIBAL|nr:DDRGK domain-containing protein 1 [Nibea albiflora]